MPPGDSKNRAPSTVDSFNAMPAVRSEAASEFCRRPGGCSQPQIPAARQPGVLLGCWVLSLAAGIAVSTALLDHVTVALSLAGSLAVSGLVLVALRRPVAGGSLLAAAAGMALACRALHPPAFHPAVVAAVAVEHRVLVEADVSRGPESATRGTRLVVGLRSIDGRPASGRLALHVVQPGWPPVGPGDRIRFRARLREPTGLANPELRDPRLAVRVAGVELVAGVSSPQALERLAAPPAWSVTRAAFLARQALGRAVDAATADAPRAFLRATVLGERAAVGPAVEEGFRAAGATHALSVSGLHLAAVAAVLFLVVRRGAARIPGLALYVDPAALAAALAIPAVAFYTVLTGSAVATERSALMAAVVLGAHLVGRPISSPATLATAAACLLVPTPLALFDVSFQLSFASVAGMALLARRLGPTGRGTGGAAVAARWLARFAAATAAATVATAPLVAHYFGEVAPAALLGNLALAPLIELVVVPVGLLGAALGAVSPWLGVAPLAVAEAAARLALAIAEVFRRTAPVWLVRTPNALETAALTACGVAALLVPSATVRGRRRLVWAAALALGVAAVSMGARELVRRSSRELRVTFLDVGQGDAALVEAPGGRTMLIDGGGTFDGSFDPGERVVEPVLRAKGISRLDVVALSHPHPDHLNGLHRIVQRFEVADLWTSGDDGRNPEYRRLVRAATERGVRHVQPAATRWAGVDVAPGGPWVGDRIAVPPGVGVNDASLVLRVGYGGRAVLFTGDLEADGEAELVGRAAIGVPVAAQFLKVPHHGSRTSSTAELLDAVLPRLAVMSLGRGNRFHFPAPDVVHRYEERGIAILRTDLHGAVSLVIGPDGTVRVSCERGCGAPAQPGAAAVR